MDFLSTSPRHDPYRNIHKGLRAAMFDAVHCVGAADVDDAAGLSAALDKVERLLRLMGAHVKHENEYLHTAIEARTAGGARRTANDHQEHVDALAALSAQAAALRGPGGRAESLHRLYLDLAEFVAENLRHMRVEETDNNAQLWALYGDDELVAIHDRLLASVEPAVMADAIAWMGRGLSLRELAELLEEIRRKAPAPAFEALLAQVRHAVDPARWSLLSRALARSEDALAA